MSNTTNEQLVSPKTNQSEPIQYVTWQQLFENNTPKVIEIENTTLCLAIAANKGDQIPDIEIERVADFDNNMRVLTGHRCHFHIIALRTIHRPLAGLLLVAPTQGERMDERAICIIESEADPFEGEVSFRIRQKGKEEWLQLTIRVKPWYFTDC